MPSPPLSKSDALICPGIVVGVPLNGDRPPPLPEPPPPPDPPPVLETVKDNPLLETPATFATTLPLLAPAGTAATMLVEDHEVGAAATPLNITLFPLDELPRFEPAIVTTVPTAPLDGETLEIVGPAGSGTSNATSAE